MNASQYVRLQILLLCSLLLAASTAWGAHSPRALANPDLDLQTMGQAHASVQLADGSVVIGGSFLTVNGIERTSLVKLLPGGQVDMDWQPQIQGTVQALAVDDLGRIYAGGSFTSTDGQDRKNLVRILPVGAGIIDSTWAPQPNGPVNALAVSSDSSPRIFAGGEFTQIGGLARQNLARLQAGNGAAVADWNTPANAPVHALSLALNELWLYVGGTFTSIGGQTRRHVAQLTAGGTVRNWAPQLESPGWYADQGWEPGVYALASPPDAGGVYIGGIFERVQGQVRLGLAQISHGSSAQPTSWAPQPNYSGADIPATVASIAVSGTGDVYVAGKFARMGSPPAAHMRLGLAKITANGNVVASWDAQLDGLPGHVAVGDDGAVLVGGAFRRAQGQPRVGWAMFDDPGQLQATTAQLGSHRGFVTNMLRQTDGGSIVVGLFDLVHGQELRQNILRLKPDGSLDPAWQPSINNYPHALAEDGQGRIYVGGSFVRVNGESRHRLARFSASGQLDANWAHEFGGSAPSVRSLMIAPNGRLYVGGQFEWIRVPGGTMVPRSNLARLFTGANGGVDPEFNIPVSGGDVVTMALAADGALFLGGAFNTVGGLPRANIARIDPGGSVSTSWTLPANSSVVDLHAGDDGWLYAAGNFSQIGGYPRRGVARLALSGNGLADANWDPAPDSLGGPIIYQLSLSDDWVHICGWYESLGALPAEKLARVSRSGNGAADPDWNPAMPEGICMAILAMDEGAVQVGGVFDEVGGRRRVSLARLSADGEVIFADGFGY